MDIIYRFPTKINKVLIYVILFLFIAPLYINAQNPFTSNSNNNHISQIIPSKNPFFIKLVLWQHELREKISEMIHDAVEHKRITTFLILFSVTFLYGAIHAAGPGHGKFIALSYLFSSSSSYLKIILFGNIIAFFHAASGIFIVLLLKYILHKTLSGTLDEISQTTELISYGLITIIGLGLFIISFIDLLKSKKNNQYIENEQKPLDLKTDFNSTIIMALSIGLVPCPAVVLIMLFCLSMGFIFLGTVLSFFIAAGMALTITCVVILGQFFKDTIINTCKKRNRAFFSIEKYIKMFGSFLIMTIGSLLFISTI